MGNDILTEHKLVILYFLDNIKSSITATDLSNFMIENSHITYLQSQQYFSELVDSNLINIYRNENKVVYKINEKGRETLEYFINRLSSVSKNLIDNYLKDFVDLSSHSLSTSFDYEDSDNNKININCSISKDTSKLFEISLPGVSKDKLDSIKSNWDNNKITIYKHLKDNLL